MPTGDTVSFVRASLADWDLIWPVFREVVSTGDTYLYPPETDEPSAQRLWMPHEPAGRVVYVARLDGMVVGTAYLRPNLPGLGDHVANAGWMVAGAFRGRGLGRRFAEHVIDDARRLGYRAMQFNAVVATNAAAVALWKSLGFEVIGTVPDAFRHRTLGPTPLLIMYRKL